jgi:O-succinylbenzoic acid--CoA ligase
MNVPDFGLLLNPKLHRNDLQTLIELKTRYQHQEIGPSYWLASSGTAGAPKLICLSAEALQVSAQNVNQHLGLRSKDIWLNVLPKFHVGGLSIFFRAQLEGSKVIDLDPFKWSALQFTQACEFYNITVTSLVPTQVSDLVSLQQKAPSSLRFVFVGGDKLHGDLYRAAVALGWNLYPTYGMTEMSSQVATALEISASEPVLKILPHMEARTEDGILLLKSNAACTGFVENEQWTAVGKEQWLRTSDLAEVSGGWLRILGRNSDAVKVNGELVSLQKIRALFCDEDAATVVAIRDLRSGKRVVAATEDPKKVDTLCSKIQQWNQQCMPLERICFLYVVKALPKSALGKLKSAQLASDLENENYLQRFSTAEI